MTIVIIYEWWNEGGHAWQPVYILQILLGSLITIFFPRLRSWNTYILHFFHLFMTFPWQQTYAMSPGEMEAKSHFKLTCMAENSPIVLPCSAAPPQENEEYKCTDRYEKERNMNTPLCFHTHCPLSAEVLYHRERWSFTMCMSSLVSYTQALWMSLLHPVFNKIQPQRVRNTWKQSPFYQRQVPRSRVAKSKSFIYHFTTQGSKCNEMSVVITKRYTEHAKVLN